MTKTGFSMLLLVVPVLAALAVCEAFTGPAWSGSIANPFSPGATVFSSRSNGRSSNHQTSHQHHDCDQDCDHDHADNSFNHTPLLGGQHIPPNEARARTAAAAEEAAWAREGKRGPGAVGSWRNGTPVQMTEREMETKLALAFTCKVCTTRGVYKVSRVAYQRGVVVAICRGCQSKHLIADNLKKMNVPGFTGNIEDYLAKTRGESVRKLSACGGDDLAEKTADYLAGGGSAVMSGASKREAGSGEVASSESEDGGHDEAGEGEGVVPLTDEELQTGVLRETVRSEEEIQEQRWQDEEEEAQQQQQQ